MTRIYILERNKVPFYVGKTKGNWRENRHKQKFGEYIDFIEIDIVEDSEWLFWEKYYISLYKSWGFKLENKNNGGGGPSNYTEEQKDKMRKPHKEGTGEKKYVYINSCSYCSCYCYRLLFYIQEEINFFYHQ